ncbi:MAG: hypothetical protein AABZ63_01585, partial [Actinomycetota bacterium]
KTPVLENHKPCLLDGASCKKIRQPVQKTPFSKRFTRAMKVGRLRQNPIAVKRTTLLIHL